MNIVESLTWENMNCGALTGAMVYKVRVGSEGSKDIVDVISAIRTHGKGKIVFLVGNFDLGNTEELFTLAKTLKDMGLVVMAKSDGNVYFPWFAHVAYLIVATCKPWPGFQVQEFHWLDALTEPIAPQNAATANVFVEGKPEDMLKFIESRSKVPWRMLLKTKILQERLL